MHCRNSKQRIAKGLKFAGALICFQPTIGDYFEQSSKSNLSSDACTRTQLDVKEHPVWDLQVDQPQGNRPGI